MKKVLEEFGGALILYMVIFVGILAVSSRMAYINNSDTHNTNNIVALSE